LIHSFRAASRIRASSAGSGFLGIGFPLQKQPTLLR
jgi:hypothetical protein